MGSELKPCPFCGGKAEVRMARCAEDAMDTWVECTECFASSDRIEDAYCDPPTAIAAWNTRHPYRNDVLEEAALRPMSEAAKDGTPVLALLDESHTKFASRWVVVRHPGLADNGLDIGWNMSAPVGYGGLMDDSFVGWSPLPVRCGFPDQALKDRDG